MTARTRRTSAFPIIVVLALVLLVCTTCAPVLTESLYMARFYEDYVGTLLSDLSELRNAIAADADGNVFFVYTDEVTYMTSLCKVSIYGQKSTVIANLEYGASALAVDKEGTLYVATSHESYENHVIQKVNSRGSQSTFVNTSGSTINAMAIDSDGSVYIADNSSGSIEKYSPDGSQLITVKSGVYAGGLAVDAEGSLFYSEYGQDRVVKREKAGAETLYTGFNWPTGVAVDSSGTAYVADSDNYLIKAIHSDGTVQVIAGSGVNESGDGVGTAASFLNPKAIAVDARGYVFVSEHTSSYDYYALGNIRAIF